MISLIWHVVVFNFMLTPLKVYPQEAAYDSDTHTPALLKMSHTHSQFLIQNGSTHGCVFFIFKC